MPRPTDKYMLTKNPYQGSYLKVLFVCSAGILRSPTAAHWAAEHKLWNTRSAGCIYGDEAGIPISGALIAWAERIYVMEEMHAEILESDWGPIEEGKVWVLGIPDNFEYRNPELIRLLTEKLKDA